MSYTEPIIWVAGDNASASRMNVVQDNIRALKAPPVGIYTVRGNGTNATTLVTTVPNAVDGGNFLVALTTTGGLLTVSFEGYLQHTANNATVTFDIQVDGSQWLSSLTTTPVTNGLWVYRMPTLATPVPVSSRHIVPAGAIAAGAHTFVLHWKVITAGTATLNLNAAVHQFVVSE